MIESIIIKWTNLIDSNFNIKMIRDLADGKVLSHLIESIGGVKKRCPFETIASFIEANEVEGDIGLESIKSGDEAELIKISFLILCFCFNYSIKTMEAFKRMEENLQDKVMSMYYIFKKNEPGCCFPPHKITTYLDFIQSCKIDPPINGNQLAVPPSE